MPPPRRGRLLHTVGKSFQFLRGTLSCVIQHVIPDGRPDGLQIFYNKNRKFHTQLINHKLLHLCLNRSPIVFQILLNKIPKISTCFAYPKDTFIILSATRHNLSGPCVAGTRLGNLSPRQIIALFLVPFSVP